MLVTLNLWPLLTLTACWPLTYELHGPFFLKFSILKKKKKKGTLKLLHLALVLKTLWQSEKHVLICRLCFSPGETLKGVWLILVYYTNSNFWGAHHTPSFNQRNIHFIPDKAYTIKTGYLEFSVIFLALKKDLLFNKVLCCAVLRLLFPEDWVFQGIQV